MFNILTILILLILAAGVIVFQIFLSKRENKWFGLILPSIGLLISFVPVFGFRLSPAGMNLSFIVQMIIIFSLSNIPTAILIILYLAIREKSKKNKEMDKMNIQDL